jgi:hypothetical protein
MVDANENWDDWEEENQDMEYSMPKLNKMPSTSSESVKVLDP